MLPLLASHTHRPSNLLQPAPCLPPAQDDKPLEGVSKPTPAADRAAREKWIRVKYVDKTFLAPLEGVDPADNTQMINVCVCVRACGVHVWVWVRLCLCW